MIDLTIDNKKYTIEEIYIEETTLLEKDILLFNISIEEDLLIKQLKKTNNNKYIKTEHKFSNLNKIKDILALFNGNKFKALEINKNTILIELTTYEDLYFLITKQEIDYYYYMLPPM